jgi:hypothetical protein
MKNIVTCLFKTVIAEPEEMSAVTRQRTHMTAIADTHTTELLEAVSFVGSALRLYIRNKPIVS